MVHCVSGFNPNSAYTGNSKVFMPNLVRAGHNLGNYLNRVTDIIQLIIKLRTKGPQYLRQGMLKTTRQ